MLFLSFHGNQNYFNNKNRDLHCNQIKKAGFCILVLTGVEGFFKIPFL